MLLQQRFRQNVLAALEARDWSGCDLAKAMRVADSNVYQYLRENGRTPGLDIIQKFADGLGLGDPIELLKEPGPQGSTTEEDAGTMPSMDGMLTVQQAADVLGISDSQVRRLCIDHNRGTKAGRDRFLSVEDVEYLRNRPAMGRPRKTPAHV